MKLIEVKTAKEFADTLYNDPILKMAANAVLDNAPGFELVRCRDCVHYGCRYGENEYFCSHPDGLNGYLRENDFCCYGERG